MNRTRTRTRTLPVLVLVATVVVGALAAPVSAGVIAPPQPGGLTGSVHFSCTGRLAVPTVTVVVRNSYAHDFGVSIWQDGTILLGNLGVPGHTSQVATFGDASWEDTTVFIDVLRIGSVVVATGSHRFDCQPGHGLSVSGASALSGGTTAVRHV